jgi:hypothetical protein
MQAARRVHAETESGRRRTVARLCPALRLRAPPGSHRGCLVETPAGVHLVGVSMRRHVPRWRRSRATRIARASRCGSMWPARASAGHSPSSSACLRWSDIGSRWTAPRRWRSSDMLRRATAVRSRVEPVRKQRVKFVPASAEEGWVTPATGGSTLGAWTCALRRCCIMSNMFPGCIKCPEGWLGRKETRSLCPMAPLELTVGP